jgi:hypothetical protein
LKLGKWIRALMITFDMVLLAVIIYNIASRTAPVEKPVFWVAAAIEIAISLLTYRFWMGSVGKKGFTAGRITAAILLVIGLVTPLTLYLVGPAYLHDASSTDIFYIWSIVGLIIYSSFTLEKRTADKS